MDLDVQNAPGALSEEAPCLLDPGPRAADLRGVRGIIVRILRVQTSAAGITRTAKIIHLSQNYKQVPLLPPPCSFHSLPSR